MPVTITLHCKPFVKHYLVKQYGLPVRIPRKTKMRNIFLACLQKNFQPSYDKYVQKLPATVEVKVNETDLKHHGHTISDSLMFFINGVFEDTIKLQMFQEVCHDHYVSGMKLRDAIKAYQERHGYNEEVFSFEAIRCAFYDIKNTSKEKKQKTATNVTKQPQ